MAILLAKAAGARTIVTTSGPERAEQILALGADHVIDRSATPDWAAEARRLTGGMASTGCWNWAGPERSFNPSAPRAPARRSS
jgi:NADPH:quinone reductase-like Zn-dependent oxidoreductase